MTDPDVAPHRSPPDSAPKDSPAPEVLDFQQLAHGKTVVLIRYGEHVYQLRATQNGKLILNK